jgi:hypothetical protein
VASGGTNNHQDNKWPVVVPSICVFDVNETLLDIEFLAPLFQRLFGDGKILREWFGQLVLYSEAITLSVPYTTFLSLGQGAPPVPQSSPLKHAGIDSWFEKSFSVDRVRRFKRRRRCTTWSPKSWMCRRLRSAWWRRMYGIRSERKAWAAAERSSPDPAMLLCPCTGCRSRTQSRRIFQAWLHN